MLRDQCIRYRRAKGIVPLHMQKEDTKMATLRKNDVSSTIAGKLGGSKADGERALKAVLDSIQDAIQNRDRVVLTGFGSFEVRSVKARQVRPVRGDGGLITVPAHNRVGFTAGAELNKSAQ